MYVNRIGCFCFLWIKNVSEFFFFFHIKIKILVTAISERQCARFLYIRKSKQLRNVFIYKKPVTSQEVRPFLLRCYIQKARQFILRNGIYIPNHDILCYVTFLYTEIQTLNFRYVLLTKTQTFLFRGLFLNFWNLRMGGHFNLPKTMHSVLNIYMKNKCTLRYVFLITKM